MGAESMLAELAATAGEFMELTLRVAPYFLLGALTGAALQIPVARRWSGRFLQGRGFGSLSAAVGIAAVLPGCSCATMPMAAGLRETGAPRLGTVAAFIFMSPLLSPVTVALTWGMLGWEIAVARVVASFAGSLTLGLILNSLESRLAHPATERSNPVNPAARPDACPPLGDRPEIRPLSLFLQSFGSIVRSVTPYFVLGMLIAAALSVLVPENAIPRLLGGASGAWAYVLASVVGIPLYVCEGEEVPITVALLGLGLGTGPSLTFLLGSVGTCVPTILMARKIIGVQATALYAVFWLLFAVAAGLAFHAAAAASTWAGPGPAVAG